MRRRRREFKLGQRRRKDEEAEGLFVRVRLDEGTVMVPDEEGAAASMVIRVDGCSSGGFREMEENKCWFYQRGDEYGCYNIRDGTRLAGNGSLN